MLNIDVGDIKKKAPIEFLETKTTVSEMKIHCMGLTAN